MWVFFFWFLQVYFWYPLNIVTGGTTAKIMLAAKDNFLGKYIYKDTLARNLAAVIYKVINSTICLLTQIVTQSCLKSCRKEKI